MATIAEQIWGQPGIHDGQITIPPYPFVNVEEAARAIRELVQAHESSEVELKSTARTNLHTGNKDEAMETAVGRTIAAFANGHGGTLLIGVADDGTICGTEIDYQWVKNKNADGFLLWLTDFVKTQLGPVLASHFRARRIEIDEHDVWRIDVPEASAPTFLSAKSGPDRFYVRMNNATHELSGAKMLAYQAYQADRWPHSA